MNNENKEGNVVNTTNTSAVNNTSVNQTTPSASTSTTSQELAGSPGIVIAPVTEAVVDASSSDKGKANVSGLASAMEKEDNAAGVTNKEVATPPVTTPRIEVKSELSSVPPTNNVQEESVVSAPPPKKKSHKGLIFFLILIIIGLGIYIYFDYQKDMNREECSPLVESDNTLRELDLNSTIVQELYDKVKTNIREDVAYHEFDDKFKLYLAFRQIPHSDFYESNCNLFNESSMTNYSCSSATGFTPKAFKEKTLQREVRKLFGENVSIPNQDVVLGSSCLGGYQYISERGEYVEGYCGSIPTTTYQVDKTLTSATVQGDTITIKEKVRYYSAQGINMEGLENGVYVHTFKLDNHYHYAYVNRTLEVE